MLAWIKEVLQGLLLVILKLIDGVGQMFNILLGLQEVTYEVDELTGEPISLVDFFLNQDTVVQIFLVLFVVSIVLLAIVCIFAIFKSMFFTGNGDQKTPTRVVGDGLKSLLTTLLAAVVTIAAIGASNNDIKMISYAKG